MNSLNSVLLEGVLNEDPFFVIHESMARMEVKITRTANAGTPEKINLLKQEFTIPVIAYNRLAEVCMQYLSKGRGIRIVGRLATKENKILLIAEHVEFKPDPKVKESKKYTTPTE